MNSENQPPSSKSPKEIQDAKDQRLGCVVLIVLAVGGFLAYFVWHYIINLDMSEANDCKQWMIQDDQAIGNAIQAGQLSYWEIQKITRVQRTPGLMKGTENYLISIIIQDGSEQFLSCTLDY